MICVVEYQKLLKEHDLHHNGEQGKRTDLEGGVTSVPAAQKLSPRDQLIND